MEAGTNENAMSKPAEGSGDKEELSGRPGGAQLDGNLRRTSSFHSPTPRYCGPATSGLISGPVATTASPGYPLTTIDVNTAHGAVIQASPGMGIVLSPHMMVPAGLVTGQRLAVTHPMGPQASYTMEQQQVRISINYQ